MCARLRDTSRANATLSMLSNRLTWPVFFVDRSRHPWVWTSRFSVSSRYPLQARATNETRCVNVPRTKADAHLLIITMVRCWHKCYSNHVTDLKWSGDTNGIDGEKSKFDRAAPAEERIIDRFQKRQRIIADRRLSLSLYPSLFSFNTAWAKHAFRFWTLPRLETSGTNRLDVLVRFGINLSFFLSLCLSTSLVKASVSAFSWTTMFPERIWLVKNFDSCKCSWREGEREECHGSADDWQEERKRENEREKLDRSCYFYNDEREKKIAWWVSIH